MAHGLHHFLYSISPEVNCGSKNSLFFKVTFSQAITVLLAAWHRRSNAVVSLPYMHDATESTGHQQPGAVNNYCITGLF